MKVLLKALYLIRRILAIGGILKVQPTLLGRFTPLHLGHELNVENAIKVYGIENLLLILGSANAINATTPYSYELRKRMIEVRFPGIKVIGFNDVRPNNERFLEDTMLVWLLNMQLLSIWMRRDFVFLGGSEKDVEYLKPFFKTMILPGSERHTNGLNISATMFREAMERGDIPAARKLLSPAVADIAIPNWQELP